MKNNLILVAILLISQYCIGQTLKTYSGPYNDGRMQNGNAVYTYYEDPNSKEYIKQGTFKYTFNGSGDYSGYNQTIIGNYENGLKNGTWTYTVTMSDFGNRNPYLTGSVTLVANYKNGYAHGNWKQIRSYKSRNKYLVYGQWKWEPFQPVKTMTINMNFSNGYIVGAVDIYDEFSNFKATGNYDNNSLCEGKWVINDMGWGKNRELLYKDNILYEFVARSNSGEVLDGSKKYLKDYDNLVKAKSLTKVEQENIGLTIDTLCGSDNCAATNNIKEYFPKMLSIDYFLYNFISGDLTFKEGFKGGCELSVSQNNYTELSKLDDFKNAELSFDKKDLLKAYTLYSNININQVKPSDRVQILAKISKIEPLVDSLMNYYKASEKFIRDYINLEYDSINIDFNKVKQDFKLKTVTQYNQYTYKNEVVEPVSQNSSYCDCKKPWDCHYGFGEFNYRDAAECFKNNPQFYEPFQKAIISSYSNVITVLDNEKKSLNSSSMNFIYKTYSHSLYTYDKDVFLSNLSLVKDYYRKSKLMMDLALKFEDNIKKVEKLNNENKKKTLFNKYSIVLNDFQNNYNAYPGIDDCIALLTDANSFIDKIVTFYSQDTKEIEKLLKDADTVNDIKSIISK